MDAAGVEIDPEPDDLGGDTDPTNQPDEEEESQRDFLKEGARPKRHGIGESIEMRRRGGYERLREEDDDDEEAETTFMDESLEERMRSDAERDLTQRQEEKERVLEGIRARFPNADASKFAYRFDDSDRIQVRIIERRGNTRWHLLSDVNEKTFPKTIRNALGKPIEEILEEKGEEKAKSDERLVELDEAVRSAQTEEERTIAESNRDAEQEHNDEISQEIQSMEERMSLKDRVKAIFKKHGVTATAVLLAVGTTIGVIVSSLTNGLTRVAKGVGKGLKDLGKKVAQILPGMVGSIVSFLFRAAG